MKPRAIGDLVREQRGKVGTSSLPVYSVTNDRGFVRPDAVFGKQVHSADISNYRRVSPGWIAYNPSRINVGSVAVCATPTPVAVSPMYVVVSCAQGLLPQYLLHFLKSPAGLRSIRNSAEGSVRFQLKFRDLQRIAIPLHPVEEQHRIVRILDEADELRKLRAEADQRTRELIAAIFHEMFGDPGTNPKGWPRVRLGAVTTIDAPMVDPRDEQYGELPHIGADRIEANTGCLLDASSAREDGLVSGKYLFGPVHVLYCKIRPYLRKAALPQFTGLCSADIYPVRPLTGHLERAYLWALLLSEAFADYTARVSVRANMPKVNHRQVQAYGAPLPPLPLQHSFAARVDEVCAMQDKQAESRRKLDELFESLLHRAFAGEL